MKQADWDQYDAEWWAEYRAEEERHKEKMAELTLRRDQLDDMTVNIFE